MSKDRFKNQISITMKHFLETYYEATNKKLIEKICKLPHKEIKKIARLYGIKMFSISFDEVSNDMIARGDILLVTDSHHNIAPYINPQISFTDELDTTLEEEFTAYEIEGEDNNDKHKRR